MFKIRLLGLLFIISSAQAMEAQLLTWDDHEAGTGLHVSAKGDTQRSGPWTLREIQLGDTQFYQDLFQEPEVTATFGNRQALPVDKTTQYVNTWVDRFSQGIPWSKLTIEQNKQAIGCVQIGVNAQRSGVGELARAFTKSAQGKGFGTEALRFIVEEWAPAIRQVGLGQYKAASDSAVNKFKCFGGEELKLIYTTSSPSNPASWSAYKKFDFHPSEPTDKIHQISCESWEQSQHGDFENYVVSKYFSPVSSKELQLDVLYDMVDEKGCQRTLSYVDNYKALRYHFEREVK
ncbi:MAG: GNAT family N-acetyltransferase [Alphaproteobacteria bacterium]|nr:GNAT family N-acetyltransferase [Alphaproteobacteria bacterium]